MVIADILKDKKWEITPWAEFLLSLLIKNMIIFCHGDEIAYPELQVLNRNEEF